MIVTDEHVNWVRLGKSKNTVQQGTLVVGPDHPISVPMFRVSSFTNQPHVSRAEQLRTGGTMATPTVSDWWLALRRDPYLVRLTLDDTFRAVRERFIDNDSHVF